MPVSNKRCSPTNISPTRQTRRKAVPDRNPVASYHEIALRAAETGQKPQEDVIHTWLQDVRDRLETSSRVNRASPDGEVDHEASWKPLFASPKTKALLKSSHALPLPQILSRDVLLHSSPPELAKSAKSTRTTKLIPRDGKKLSSTEEYAHESVKVTSRTFEKRPRNKTRQDRYDTKKRSRPTYRQTAPQQKKRRETVQDPRLRSGPDIMKNFASSYIGQGRIALKPNVGSGLFANGKGSDAQPMFNLKFAETAFPIDHTHTPIQTDRNDRAKHKGRTSKELEVATGFFQQSNLTKLCFDSRTSLPATPLHKQSSLFGTSSAVRQPINEVIVRSIEDVHPSQRIITETPYSKSDSPKQIPSLAKSRRLVGASRRGSILRLSSQHISSASGVSQVFTPCRPPRSPVLNKSTESRTIQSDTRTSLVRCATSGHQRKTQTGPDRPKRPNPQVQSISKQSEANSNEPTNFDYANIGLATECDGPVIENSRFDGQAKVIDQQPSLQGSSRLQEAETSLIDKGNKFLSSLKPPIMRQIWDADSIDAAISNNHHDFEPVRTTSKGHKKIDFDIQEQELHDSGESDIPHTRQSRFFATNSNFAVWRGLNAPLEHDARNQAAKAAPVGFEQATSNECLTESNARVSSAAMRAFWKPNYLV